MRKRNMYESEKLLSEYLQFHYLNPSELFLKKGIIDLSKNFSVQCVELCGRFLKKSGKKNIRALDLGCATGRSTFELTRFCSEVVGVDYSFKFIAAAKKMQQKGRLQAEQIIEGEIKQNIVLSLPRGAKPERASFQQGDAHRLPQKLGTFDLVLMANLIDRLHSPKQCLENIESFLNPGGILVITSPYTWLEDFTPKKNWIGGKQVQLQDLITRRGLQNLFKNKFRLLHSEDVPFLIREHARKFQLSVAEATIWMKC